METTIQKEEKHTQSNEEVARELSIIWKVMSETAKNWDSKIAASLWTEDGINMPVYGINQTRQEMMVFIKDIVDNNKWEFVEFKPLELFVHDDMAYEFSLVEHNMIPNDGGKTVNTKMRCITVYKKEEGTWKIHRWMPQYFVDM